MNTEVDEYTRNGWTMKFYTHLAIISVIVQDQDEALGFYTEKLGLEKRADVTYGRGMRWLTVAPRGQKRPEIALAKPESFLHSEKQLQAIVDRVGKGTAWVFDTDDCYTMYRTLRARGVTFLNPPTRQLYGTEARFTDPYGNVFSLLEPSPEASTMYSNIRVGTAA